MQSVSILLEDGQKFSGFSFTSFDFGMAVGELVFNTAMTGYQEVVTDPSYAGQIVVMTYPLIGNHGLMISDMQSKRPHLAALVVAEYCTAHKNPFSSEDLAAYLLRFGVLGVTGVDTRTLTRSIRDKGAQYAVILPEGFKPDREQVFIQAKKDAKILVSRVSTAAVYRFNTEGRYTVAVIDCGCKLGILEQLVSLGCACIVFPFNTSKEDLDSYNVDGVLISNGPGHPEDVREVCDLVKSLLGHYPIFGICLGHQILSLCLGAKIYKLPFGHHGLNHPVKELASGKVKITSQNHIYCVSQDNIPDTLTITHVNLNDGTIAGIFSEKYSAYSVQYHPEASPGPVDASTCFFRFISMMEAVESSA